MVQFQGRSNLLSYHGLVVFIFPARAIPPGK